MRWLSSVRVRIALLAAILLGALSATGAWWFVHSVEAALLGDIRAQATTAADEAAAAVRAGSPRPAASRTDALVQVLTNDGSPLPPTLGIVGEATQPSAAKGSAEKPAPTIAVGPTDAAPSFETTVDGVQYTVSTKRVGGPTGSYLVLAALPLEDVQRTVDAVKDRLAVGLPALVFLAALLAWFLAGRALRPIERMRVEAEAITAATVDRRLPRPDAHDEVGRLADTMNQMLDRLHEAAERQRRFISDASHELRSPIATLQADLEIGLAHAAEADWAGIARAALRDADQLNTLVDELLELASLEERRSSVETEIDLADVVREESCRPRRVPVHVEADHPAPVVGDPGAIVSLVRNLLDNAARHASSVVRVSVATEASSHVIQLDDDGPGLPPEERDRVFERFARVDPSRSRLNGGVGLGLAIVKRVVEAHAGAVTVRESEFGGACFVVRLPALRGEPLPDS